MNTDAKVTKVDDKKGPTTKPAFSGPSPAPQRKDSTGQKVDVILKPDDIVKVAAISTQVPQPHRSEKTPPFTGEKPQHR